MATSATTRMLNRVTFNGSISRHRVAEVRERIESLRQKASRIDWLDGRLGATREQAKALYGRAARIEEALDATEALPKKLDDLA